MDVDRIAYLMMEGNYIKQNNRKIEEDNRDLFPNNWYENTNYQLKTNILFEAIKNNILIKNTKLYKETMIEGVY